MLQRKTRRRLTARQSPIKFFFLFLSSVLFSSRFNSVLHEGGKVGASERARTHARRLAEVDQCVSLTAGMNGAAVFLFARGARGSGRVRM